MIMLLPPPWCAPECTPTWPTVWSRVTGRRPLASTVTTEDIGQAVAPLFSRQSGEDERVGEGRHFTQGVSSPSDDDDDHRHPMRGRLCDQRELLGSEAEIGGIAELAGGVSPGQPTPAPDENDRGVGALHLVDDLDQPSKCLQGRGGRVLRGELPEFVPHRRQRRLLLLQFEMRREVVVAQKEAWIIRARTENRDACAGCKRQDAIVGEEHDGSRGRPPRQGPILQRVEQSRCR